MHVRVFCSNEEIVGPDCVIRGYLGRTSVIDARKQAPMSVVLEMPLPHVCIITINRDQMGLSASGGSAVSPNKLRNVWYEVQV